MSCDPALPRPRLEWSDRLRARGYELRGCNCLAAGQRRCPLLRRRGLPPLGSRQIMSVDWSAVLQVAQENDEYHVPVTRTHHRSTAPTSARSRRALFVSRGSDQRGLAEAVWWIGIGPFRAALLRWTGAA